jgi:hypothetical protein
MDLAVGLKKVKPPCETARGAAAVGSAGAPAARVPAAVDYYQTS